MKQFLAHDSLLAELETMSFDRPPALVANAHITGLGVARALLPGPDTQNLQAALGLQECYGSC